MSLDDLERRLSVAQERYTKSVMALAPKHKGGEMLEYKSAYQDLLAVERELAAAKGEEYAVTLDFPVRWNTGAPLPHLLMSDHRTFLTFYVAVPDPNWDGSYVTVKNPGDDSVETLALVTFKLCMSAKMGAPNDEVFHGHPLHGRGLEGYRAQVVQNSKWLKELEEINSVHAYYKPEKWRALKHYVLWFHDSTFECVAESFEVEVFEESMSDLLGRVRDRLLMYSSY